MKKPKMFKPWFFRSITVILIIAFIVATPIIINYIYMLGKNNVQSNTVFEASDLLVIYSACLGVIGVFFSIQYAQSNYRTDVHHRVLPFIGITPLLTSSKIDLFSYYFLSPFTQDGIDKTDSQENDYSEFKMDRFYFIVSNSEVMIRKELSPEQQLNIKTGLSKLSIKNESGVYYSDVYYIPLEIENVGNGAAINLEVGLSKEKQKPYAASMPSTFKVNDKIYIGLYFDFSAAPQQDTTYILSFGYEDIYQNQYTQSFKYIAKVEKTVIWHYTNIQIGRRNT